MTFIKKATQLEVQAIVVECMGIEPQLQLFSEVGMIRSTIGVITAVFQAILRPGAPFDKEERRW